MRNKWYVLSMVLLVAALLALPGVARSAMWVGAELGGNFVCDLDINVGIQNHQFEWDKVSANQAVIGGLTIGYDFVNSGFGGYNWPDWMKYFFFATDFTFNRLDIHANPSPVNWSHGVEMFPPGALFGQRVEGYQAAWTFLFAYHYGFFPDSEIPVGRVHPYIGVGPAILFSGLNVKGLGSKSSVDPALVVETGIRWILLKNVSVDTSMRYRYAHPTYAFNTSTGESIDITFPAHEFSFLVRANYHF